MHCENAPCIAVCPTSARFKRDDGLVLVDWDKCIGCGYCLIACPYDVNYIHRKTLLKPSIREAYGDEPIYRIPEGDNRRGFGIPPRGVAEKCTFCVHRIDKGVRKGLTPGVDMEASPACVEACPARALAFGDLDDPRSEVSRLVAGRKGFRLREELGTKPQVYYLR
jgi:Fe-S-cluster-containing dehydrogenase component